jgi:hypothetical protein
MCLHKSLSESTLFNNQPKRLYKCLSERLPESDPKKRLYKSLSERLSKPASKLLSLPNKSKPESKLLKLPKSKPENKLNSLPNDIIEYIAYMSDIDVRLALNIKPKKLSTDQKNINLSFKNIVIFEDPYIILRIYGKSSITRIKIIQGDLYKSEIHKTTINTDGTIVSNIIIEN